MGNAKREKNRAKAAEAGKDASSKRITRPLKGENFYRDSKKVKQLNMLKGGKATRDAKGKIVKAAAFQERLSQGTVSRIENNRKWFGNTRTIGQDQLAQFREAIQAKAHDPFQVLLHRHKLPMSLLTDPTKMARMNLLTTESFGDAFGPKARRKRPKLANASVEEIATSAYASGENYEQENDKALLMNYTDEKTELTKEWYERAGQSRRIWSELYKVSDQ